MAEYIKRESVLKRIKGEAQFQYDQFGTVDTVIRSYATCYDVVKTEPAAEVVEVVRCKDCRYYCINNDICAIAEAHDFNLDDFCSYGERRENGQADH